MCTALIMNVRGEYFSVLRCVFGGNFSMGNLEIRGTSALGVAPGDPLVRVTSLELRDPGRLRGGGTMPSQRSMQR